jgi:hypothetical protein
MRGSGTTSPLPSWSGQMWVCQCGRLPS